MTNTVTTPSFTKQVSAYFRAGYQALYVRTTEETRCLKDLQAISDDLGLNFVTWDMINGLSHVSDSKFCVPSNAIASLKDDSVSQKAQLTTFLDLHNHQSNDVRRMLRTLINTRQLVRGNHRRPIILLSPYLDLDRELESLMPVVDYALPDDEGLEKALNYIIGSLGRQNADAAQVDDDLKQQIIYALRGLSYQEACDILSLCLVFHGGFSDDIFITIEREKATVLKKSNTLSYKSKGEIESMDMLKGYGNLNQWLDQTMIAYSPEAIQFGIERPKGVSLLGPAGVGKSTCAYSIARRLGTSCIIANVPGLFGSLVGQSEGNVETMINQVTALKRCVLVLDEIDKTFAKAHESSGDSGTTTRVFGRILNWLADKQDDIYVVMTMNDTAGLPAELLRKGRSDELFFVDLPTPNERKEIIVSHLERRGIDVDAMGMGDDEWQSIEDRTQMFVGAELEHCVKRAILPAFARSNKTSIQPTFEDLYTELAGTNPVARVDEARVSRLRQFGNDRCVPVSTEALQSTDTDDSRPISI